MGYKDTVKTDVVFICQSLRHISDKHLFKLAAILVIRLIENRAWYDYIGIHPRSPKVTVYLPPKRYADLRICEDTGDIVVPKDFQFEDVDISLSTGDVDFCSSASNQLKVKTSTGNIKGTLLSKQVFLATTDTGRVDVPQSITGCKCEINTDTGSIQSL